MPTLHAESPVLSVRADANSSPYDGIPPVAADKAVGDLLRYRGRLEADTTTPEIGNIVDGATYRPVYCAYVRVETTLNGTSARVVVLNRRTVSGTAVEVSRLRADANELCEFYARGMFTQAGDAAADKTRSFWLTNASGSPACDVTLAVWPQDA